MHKFKYNQIKIQLKFKYIKKMHTINRPSIVQIAKEASENASGTS